MSDNTKQLYKKSSDGSYPKIFPLAFVQGIKDKRNDKELLSYINEINHFKVDYNENPETTRCQVDNFIRKKGLYITYYNNDTNESVTEYFKGNQSDVTDDSIWGNSDNWELVPDKTYIESHAVIPDKSINMDKLADDVVQAIGDSGLSADEEDITDRDSILKFKDKEYNLEEASGLGYKILRKNWVGDKNILTQDMISDENTIYIIKYDFVLGENIIVPANCVFKFEGGSINEGIITLSVGCSIIDANHTLNTNLYIIAANGCYIDGININISEEMTNHIISCNSVNNVVIKNVKTNVEQHLGHYNSCGICIENGSTNILVEKCIICKNEMVSVGAEAATAPILINDSTYSQIINSNIIGAVGDGIYVGGVSSHILIKGCYVDFSNNNYTDGWSGIATGESVNNPNSIPEYITCEGCTVIGGIATMYSFNANNSILTNCVGKNNTNLGGIALGHPGNGARIHNTIVSNCIIERDNTNHSNKKAAICPMVDGPVLIDNVKFIGKEVIAAVKVTGKETITGVKPLVKVTNCYAKNATVFLDQEFGYNTEDASDVDVEIENCTLDSGYGFAYNNAAPDKYIIKGCVINTANVFCQSETNSITDIIDCIGNVTNAFLTVGAAKQVNLINNKVIGVYAITLHGAPDVINIDGGEYNLSDSMIYTTIGECSICNLSIKNSIIHFVNRLSFSTSNISKDFGVYNIENNTIYVGSDSTLIWLNGIFNRNAPLLTVRGNIIHNTGTINIIVIRGSVESGVTLTPAYCQLVDNILDTSYVGNNDTVGAYKTIYTSRNVVDGVVEV